MKKFFSFVLALSILFGLTSCTTTFETSSLDEYLLTDVPMAYTEFLLFPQKESLGLCSVNQYQSASVSTLLFDDIYFLLSCTYTSQQYEQELARLKQIDAEYHDDLFAYPSYVMLFYAHNYEYALLDDQNSTIIYVAAQTSDFSPDSTTNILRDFPSQYLPTKLPATEICKYQYG